MAGVLRVAPDGQTLHVGGDVPAAEARVRARVALLRPGVPGAGHAEGADLLDEAGGRAQVGVELPDADVLLTGVEVTGVGIDDHALDLGPLPRFAARRPALPVRQGEGGGQRGGADGAVADLALGVRQQFGESEVGGVAPAGDRVRATVAAVGVGGQAVGGPLVVDLVLAAGEDLRGGGLVGDVDQRGGGALRVDPVDAQLVAAAVGDDGHVVATVREAESGDQVDVVEAPGLVAVPRRRGRGQRLHLAPVQVVDAQAALLGGGDDQTGVGVLGVAPDRRVVGVRVAAGLVVEEGGRLDGGRHPGQRRCRAAVGRLGVRRYGDHAQGHYGRCGHGRGPPARDHAHHASYWGVRGPAACWPGCPAVRDGPHPPWATSG